MKRKGESEGKGLPCTNSMKPLIRLKMLLMRFSARARREERRFCARVNADSKAASSVLRMPLRMSSRDSRRLERLEAREDIVWCF